MTNHIVKDWDAEVYISILKQDLAEARRLAEEYRDTYIDERSLELSNHTLPWEVEK